MLTAAYNKEMSLSGDPGFRRFVLAVLAFSTLSWSCTSSAPAKPEQHPKPPAAQPDQQLWGDLKPIVSVKELMRDMIDPASDFVFDSVGTVVTRKGRVERVPKT
jgi:hypothetical protein